VVDDNNVDEIDFVGIYGVLVELYRTAYDVCDCNRTLTTSNGQNPKQ